MSDAMYLKLSLEQYDFALNGNFGCLITLDLKIRIGGMKFNDIAGGRAVCFDSNFVVDESDNNIAGTYSSILFDNDYIAFVHPEITHTFALNPECEKFLRITFAEHGAVDANVAFSVFRIV